MDDCPVFIRLCIGDLRIGPGKVALLEAVDRVGSISGAARALGMSYRRAWNLIDELNRGFVNPAVTTRVGGSPDQGARVTEFGRLLVARYRRLEASALAAAADTLEFLGSQTRPDVEPSFTDNA